jgi:DNA-binding NtrC family response regulator
VRYRATNKNLVAIKEHVSQDLYYRLKVIRGAPSLLMFRKIFLLANHFVQVLQDDEYDYTI